MKLTQSLNPIKINLKISQKHKHFYNATCIEQSYFFFLLHVLIFSSYFDSLIECDCVLCRIFNSSLAQSFAETCDIIVGEWLPDPSGPFYTNESCHAIEAHQNCMKNGRPDSGYLYWRWTPRDCELPKFDPGKFLDTMKNKSWAFIGDSISRNHVQSLLCILSQVRDLSISLIISTATIVLSLPMSFCPVNVNPTEKETRFKQLINVHCKCHTRAICFKRLMNTKVSGRS